MKTIYITVLLFCLTFLSGCANLYAGISQYYVKLPIYAVDKTTKQVDYTVPPIGYWEVKITSGKDATSVNAHFTKDGDKITLDLTETGVSSSASITAANTAVSDISKAVSNTAVTIDDITKKVP